MPFDRERFLAARLRAAGTQPFLATALYALTAVDAPGRRTFGVDEALRLHVDGEALERWTIAEAAGVLLHEVGHVVRDHAGRARVVGVTPEHHRRWNVAADAEINDDLVAAGVTLPDNPVLPSGLGMAAGAVAESYYHRLGTVPDGPDCGSGCHGLPTPEEEVAVASTPDLPSGLSAPELLVLRRRVAEEIRASEARRAGSVGGGWTRWAEAVLDPVIDWRTVLDGRLRRAVADVAGRVDYTYARPGRRRMPRVVLPAMRRPLPSVGVVIDVSASVGDDDLAIAWSEVHGCLRAIGVRRELLRVYATDTDTTRVADVTSARVSLSGGGGTDLRHGIETALGERPRPGVLVVLTDGFTPWPERPTPVPLITVLFPIDAELRTHRPDPPDWARVVEVAEPLA